MAEDTRNSKSDPAEPPGGGRQDHDAMRVAAMRPVVGPASSDTLAAGGGLELPGREPQAADEVSRGAGPVAAPADVHEPIPGERDPGTLTSREPGAIGGQFSGADIPSSTPRTESDATDLSPGSDTRTEIQSQTGGRGAEAHTPSPNRATGDDETIQRENSKKER